MNFANFDIDEIAPMRDFIEKIVKVRDLVPHSFTKFIKMGLIHGEYPIEPCDEFGFSVLTIYEQRYYFGRWNDGNNGRRVLSTFKSIYDGVPDTSSVSEPFNFMEELRKI